MALKVTVVSPERPLFEGEAEHVVVPGVGGELGIYPRHAPLIGALGPGLIRIHTGGAVERYAIRGGFVHVKKDVVTLAVTDAVRRGDVTHAEIQRELDSVIDALRRPHSGEEYEELLLRRRWCEVRLALHDEAQTLPH